MWYTPDVNNVKMQIQILYVIIYTERVVAHYVLVILDSEEKKRNIQGRALKMEFEGKKMTI